MSSARTWGSADQQRYRPENNARPHYIRYEPSHDDVSIHYSQNEHAMLPFHRINVTAEWLMRSCCIWDGARTCCPVSGIVGRDWQIICFSGRAAAMDRFITTGNARYGFS